MSVSSGGAVTLDAVGSLAKWLFQDQVTFTTGSQVDVVDGIAFNFNMTTGTSPFTVDSTTVVANLHAANSDQLEGNNLASVQNHAPAAHDITSASHTESGLTTGDVLQATGATTFAWQTMNIADMSDVTIATPVAGEFLRWSVGSSAWVDSTIQISDLPAHDPSSHDIITLHTASGLTTNHVLKATGATTFAFGNYDTLTSDLAVGGNGLTNVGEITYAAGTGLKIASTSDDAHTWLPSSDGSIYLTSDVDESEGYRVYMRKFASPSTYTTGFAFTYLTNSIIDCSLGDGQIHRQGAERINLQSDGIHFSGGTYRLKYDGSNYLTATVSSQGAVTWDAVGALAKHIFSDPVLFNGLATLSASMKYDGSSQTLSANTSDTADNLYFGIAGGGTDSADRGSYIRVHGNEYTAADGQLWLTSGNVGSGIGPDGTIRLYIRGSEVARFSTNGAAIGVPGNTPPTQGITASILKSTTGAGAPLEVNSTTVVANLNVSYLEGQSLANVRNHAPAAHSHGADEVSSGTFGSGSFIFQGPDVTCQSGTEARIRVKRTSATVMDGGMYANSNVFGIYNWTDSESILHYTRNAQVRLYYNGSEKLRTETAGAECTGTFNATVALQEAGTGLAAKYLGISAKAADSQLLDNYDSTAFPRKAEAATISGVWTFTAIPAFNGGSSGSTAPFTVDSTYKVANLNADYLDGYTEAAFPRLGATNTYTATNTFRHLQIASGYSLGFNGGVSTRFYYGGTQIWYDDNSSNDSPIAAVKAITNSATAPTGDYPWGTFHVIY
jgi:hypothetical protein